MNPCRITARHVHLRSRKNGWGSFSKSCSTNGNESGTREQCSGSIGRHLKIQPGISQGMHHAGGGWKNVSGCDFRIGNASSSSSNDDDVLSSQRALLPSPCAHFHLQKTHSLARTSSHRHCHSFVVESPPACLFTSAIERLRS